MIFQDANHIEGHIIPSAPGDELLFNTFLKQRVEFEDSFHHLQIYFNAPGQVLFRFHCEDALIFFSEDRRGHISVFKPLGPGGFSAYTTLLPHLAKGSRHPLELGFLGPEHLRGLEEEGLELKRLHGQEFLFYDLFPGTEPCEVPPGFHQLEEAACNSILELEGREFREVRQKCSLFSRNQLARLEVEELTAENLKDGIHFFARWGRMVQGRGASYVNTGKNKHALRYMTERMDPREFWCRLYRINGMVEGVQALHRLNGQTASHIIGAVNTTVPGFSEWSQRDIWKQVAGDGVRFIHDGYSWKKRLLEFKMKFRPACAKTVCRAQFEKK